MLAVLGASEAVWVVRRGVVVVVVDERKLLYHVHYDG